MEIIDVNEVTKIFNTTKAVNKVNFKCSRGRIFGLLGPNGAGKTTTIRMINNILAPDSGTISINGQLVSGKTQEWIGYMPEERGLYRKMKVGEQLLFLAQLKGLSYSEAQRKIKYWLDRFKIQDWYNKEIGELSKGMSQKVQFIATVVHDPEIFIFDEPFGGLDPINSELLKEIIIELRHNKKTILFSTHRMEQVEQMCDDICLFNNGKAVLKGNLREIKQSYGKNTINIEFQGDPHFLDQLQNVRINNRSTNFAELRILNGEDEQLLLRHIMDQVSINRFEFVEPSLTEIFISTVGEDNVNPTELA